jgi:predicted RNA-binding protein with PIN domain
MGKGDGKKKRKKNKSALAISSSSVTSAADSQSPPQRVTNDINIPVRHQIRWAQMKKEASRQASPGYRKPKVVRTSYRRTWDEEEIELKREERKRKGQEPNWDVILNQTASSPLVIVDGYNIIHKWSRLKKHMIKGDPARARQLLIDDLENLRVTKSWRIECVFDGAGKSRTGPLGDTTKRAMTVAPADRASTKDVSKYGVRVVFTGSGVEADTYIEARCAEAKSVTEGILTRSFIVATDDAMVKMAGQSAGAMLMSATRFVDELKAVKAAVSYRVEAAVAKANGHAIRPEKLRGTYFHKFGRGSVLIEDKRNRPKKNKNKEDDQEVDKSLLTDIEVEVDETGIPWWAKVPDQNKFK